jgi:L-fucose isomerase-like protein
MKKEAEQIEKKVRENRSLDDIKVSDEMEKELFNKIQDYEYDKRHKKVVRKKKKSKLVIGALAAVLILVCGSVMTSVGSKSYWKTLWNDSNGDEQNNGIDVENMESIETEDIDEMEVDKKITKVMGVSLVKMQYKPKDMVLKRYIIDEEQRMAILFYQYGEEVIKYYMYTNSTDSSFGEKTVDQLLDEYEFQNGKHSILVKQYEIKNSDEERYIAEFEYNDIHYQIKGSMEKEEFEKILENLFFM